MKLTPILALALMVAGAVPSFLIGGELALQSDYADRQASWSNVRVINSGGTLVANPAAMTPTQLADATILLPWDTNQARLVAIGCPGQSKALLVREEDEAPEGCREIIFLG